MAKIKHPPLLAAPEVHFPQTGLLRKRPGTLWLMENQLLEPMWQPRSYSGFLHLPDPWQNALEGFLTGGGSFCLQDSKKVTLSEPITRVTGGVSSAETTPPGLHTDGKAHETRTARSAICGQDGTFGGSCLFSTVSAGPQDSAAGREA